MRFDLSTLASMPHSQKMGRALDKRDRILKFLASGEVYLSVNVASKLLSVSRSVAQLTLQALEKQKSLKSEVLLIPDEDGQPRRSRIFGISPHGLAETNADSAHPVFELGRTNPLWVPHHRCCQISRIAAEDAGWTGWIPERRLRDGIAKLKKIPDAIATSPNGKRVAIEVERHVKTQKRYEEIQKQYLLDLKNGRIDGIAYICPPKITSSVQRIFRHVERQGFLFFDFDGWPHTHMPRLQKSNPEEGEEEMKADTHVVSRVSTQVVNGRWRYSLYSGDKLIAEFDNINNLHEYCEKHDINVEE